MDIRGCKLVCYCGNCGKPANPKALYVVETKQLMAQCWCPTCKHNFVAEFDLQRLLEICPEPVTNGFTLRDISFLTALRIKDAV